MPFDPSPVFQDERWKSIEHDPVKLEKAQDKLFTQYVSASPERQQFYDQAEPEQRARLRSEFTHRLETKYPDAFKSLVTYKTARVPSLNEQVKLDFKVPQDTPETRATLAASGVQPNPEVTDIAKRSLKRGFGRVGRTGGSVLDAVDDYFATVGRNLRGKFWGIADQVAPELMERKRREVRAERPEGEITAAEPRVIDQAGEALWDWSTEFIERNEEALPNPPLAEDPSQLLDVKWWAANLPEQAVYYVPAVAVGLLSGGSAAVAGLTAGILESGEDYTALKEEGVKADEAFARAALGVAAISTLNRAGFRPVFKKGGGNAIKRAVSRFVAEGSTDYIEEPTQLGTRDLGRVSAEEFEKRLARTLVEALDVIPLAGVSGVGGGVVSDLANRGRAAGEAVVAEIPDTSLDEMFGYDPPASTELQLKEVAEDKGRLLEPAAEPAAPTQLDDVKFPIVEVPVAEIQLSKDVPNFKEEANPETGEVRGKELQGTFDRRGTGPIIVWERRNGDREVISGRHRLALARRSGEETIPAQVVREADGFDKSQALVLDAELNIRDGQGTVRDYADYFRNREGISYEEARQANLLRDAKGNTGWNIGKGASDDLYAAYRAGKISEPKAAAIGELAPGDPAVQAAAMADARKLSVADLREYTKSLTAAPKSKTAENEQGDLFGFDDSVLKESRLVAKQASKAIGETIEQERTLRQAITRGGKLELTTDQAKALGIRNRKDDAQLTRALQAVQNERARLERWHTDPELMDRFRREAGLPVVGKRKGGDVQELEDADAIHHTAGLSQFPPKQEVAAREVSNPDWLLNQGETKSGKRLIDNMSKAKDGRKVGLQSVVEYVNRSVGVEMRRSKSQTSRKNPAHYRPRGHMTFTRAGASQINFHEAGHGLKELVESRNKKWFQHHKTELLSLTRAPGSMASAQNVHEGVAEWLRLRMVNPALVEDLQFTKSMDSLLKGQFPDLSKQLRDASRAMHRMQQRPVAVRWSMVANAPRPLDLGGFLNAVIRGGDALVRIFSSGAPLSKIDRAIFKSILKNRQEMGLTYKQAVKFARQQRKNTTELIEAYNMILIVGSETQNAMDGRGELRGIRAITEKGNFKQIFPMTWREIVGKIAGSRWQQFQEAGWAKEALNRYEQDGMEYPGFMDGITPADLQDIVDKARREIPRFDEAVKAVQNYFDALLDMKLLGGLKTREEVVKMRRRGDYWPLPRMVESMGSGIMPRGHIQAGDYRARGSAEAFKDITVVAEERTRDALSAYYWNQLGMKIVKNLTDVSGNDKLSLNTRAIAGLVMTPMKLSRKVAATVKQEEVIPWVLDEINRQKAKAMGRELTKDERVSAADVNLSWNFKDVWRPTAPKDWNVVSLLRDGKREFYQIGDPGLFHLMASTEQSSSISKFVEWALKPMMQNWKRNITQSLPFAFNNLSGDMINQVMLNRDAIAWFPGGATMLGMMNRYTKKYPQVFQEGLLLSRVEPSSIEVVNHIKRNAVWQFLSEGFYISQAKNPVLKFVSTVLQPSNILFPIWKTADLINFVTFGKYLAPRLEGATREGAAVYRKMKGGTDAQALHAYWRATGTFNDHAGVSGVRTLMSLPGFANPMLQAGRNAIQNLSDPDPGIRGASWLKLTVVIPGLFGTAAAIRYLLMNDDDRERERERTLEDRLAYHDIGGMRIRFPYGPEGAMASWTYNSVMDELLDRDPGGARIKAKMLLNRIGSAKAPMEFLGPQLKSLEEAKLNWSIYRQRHIVSPWMTALPASEQFYSTTPEFYKKLGRWVNYSPAKIEYIVQNALNRQVDETIDVFNRIQQGRPLKENAELPFVGRMFIQNPLGFSSLSVIKVEEIDQKLQMLDLRLNSAGYGYMKHGTAIPGLAAARPEMEALRQQLLQLQGLRFGLNQMPRFWKLAKFYRLNNDWNNERNTREQLVRYAQSLLANNTNEIERIDQALDLLEEIEEAPPEEKAMDYMRRSM